MQISMNSFQNMTSKTYQIILRFMVSSIYKHSVKIDNIHHKIFLNYTVDGQKSISKNKIT
jgi:hypothetical protein